MIFVPIVAGALIATTAWLTIYNFKHKTKEKEVDLTKMAKTECKESKAVKDTPVTHTVKTAKNETVTFRSQPVIQPINSRKNIDNDSSSSYDYGSSFTVSNYSSSCDSSSCGCD